MKKHIKRGLSLNRETLRSLSGEDLAGARGAHLTTSAICDKRTMASSTSEADEGPTYCYAPNCPNPHQYT